MCPELSSTSNIPETGRIKERRRRQRTLAGGGGPPGFISLKRVMWTSTGPFGRGWNQRTLLGTGLSTEGEASGPDTSKRRPFCQEFGGWLGKQPS